MPETGLTHRPGVELVNVGSWQLLSGSWNPNRKDILAAVEAAQCPAVRRPKLKLGHLDPRFNEPDEAQLDGTPSLGWFDNLRASNDGNTLLGDQVALPWLSQVQAAAYPDRSIEGKHNTRCALGHVHPFVITAVSLLGETPPGIPTLKSITSLDDLPAALGVAASGEDTEGGEDVQATVRAAAEPDEGAEPEHTGAMIALIPTAEDAERFAVDGGDSADELHVTLAYLGEAADLGAQGKQDIIDAVSTAANGLPLIDAELFSVNAFNPTGADDREPCLVWGVTGEMLDAVHDLVDDALFSNFIDAPIPSQHRPWVAHMTAAYTGDLSRIAELAQRVGPVRFDRLRLAFAGEHIDIPLIEWPAEEPDGDPAEVAAAGGNADQLHDYWTKGAGLAKWRDKPHPWTALFKELRKHLSVERAKRVASKWFLEVTGHTPNQKVKASDGSPIGPPQPADPAFVLPAAEPEQEINPDPKEDLVSTELSGLRSRLGLSDDADLTAIEAKVDELKTKADTPAAAEPTPEMVAASQAAEVAREENVRLTDKVQILDDLVKQQGEELAAIRAEKATAAKETVLASARLQGKFKPADLATWEARYDKAPEVTTEILASIPVGAEVPVMASGTAGSPEPETDDDFDALVARIDMPTGKGA